MSAAVDYFSLIFRPVNLKGLQIFNDLRKIKICPLDKIHQILWQCYTVVENPQNGHISK